MESFLAWLIESSLLVLMIFGIRKVFSGKVSHAGIYALWLVVLFRFLIPVNFIHTPVSVADLVMESLDRQEGAAPDRTVQHTEENREEGIEGENGSRTAPAGLSAGRAAQSGVIPVSWQEMGLTGQTGDKEPAGKRNTDWMSVLGKIWASVSVVLFLWILLSNLCLLGKLKKSRVLCGQRQSVRIYATDAVSGPCLYGFFHPAVYIPGHLLPSRDNRGEERKEWNRMITHELVHYRHRDHIWAMLRTVLISVYWFDPLLWMAVSASRKDAELFCDETVIRILGEEERFGYGEMLVRLAGAASWGDFRYSMMSMSRRGKEMEQRIRAISTRRHYSRWILLPLAALLLMAVSVTGSAGYGPLAKEKNQAGQQESTVTGGSVDAGEPDVEDQTDAPVKLPGWTAGFSDVYRLGRQNAASVTPEDAFENYLQTFTDAVNTGDTGELYHVLEAGSRVYRQQSALVRNYYKRGIREEIKSYDVSSVRNVAEDTVELSSREQIYVYYADGTSKLVKQKYRYTCRYTDMSWMISGMKAIS